MQITIFSFLMAVIWGTIIVLIQYILIKKRYFIKMFGIMSVLLLYIFSMVRMLLPIEFPFTKVIDSIPFWNWMYTYLCIENIKIIGVTFTRGYLLILAWLCGSILISVRFAVKYSRAMTEINTFETTHNKQAERILEKIMTTERKKIKIEVLTTEEVETPVGIGVRKKRIILPKQNYSEKELYYILLHELTHFKNKDIPLKILIQLFCCIFWWNPIVYFLRKDLEQVLEIKCDLAIVENMDKKRKINYLSAIVQVIKGQESSIRRNSLQDVSIVGDNQEENLIERFMIVSDNEKIGGLRSKIIWYTGIAGIVLSSYVLVIQPKYQPPKEDIVTEEGTLDISPDNYYIVQQDDGTFFLSHKDAGKTDEIDKRMAEDMIKNGFVVRKGK